MEGVITGSGCKLCAWSLTIACTDGSDQTSTIAWHRVVLTLLAAGLIAAAPPSCPAAVEAQLGGLYAWQVARMQQPGRGELASQIKRFTPELYQQLQWAWQLDPRVDGAYLDFDVFSDTQMETYGATVQGCNRLSPQKVDASVAVLWGRGGRAVEAPQVLSYALLWDGSSWRISDITYRKGQNDSSTLTDFLKRLRQAVAR